MKVSELMKRDVLCCSAADPMERAAQIMWERDCGCVPVVDEEQHVLGMITDRDICMASYTRGQPPAAVSVAQAMSNGASCCRAGDELEAVLGVLSKKQLHRLPVVDGENRLVGLISLADVIQTVGREGRGRLRWAESVLTTLLDVSAPRVPTGVLQPASRSARESSVGVSG